MASETETPPESIPSEFDGVFFSYVISEHHFGLRLLRCLPLGRIRLRDIQYIRQRGSSDLGDLFADMLFHPFRSWYWPHPLFMGGMHDSAAYVIRTSRGTRVYARLNTRFHYRLRAALGRARAAEPPRPGDWSENPSDEAGR